MVLNEAKKSFEEKYKNTITHVDKRTKNYRELILRVVNIHTSNSQELKKAKYLLRDGLRTLFLYDFYYETQDKDYFISAWTSEEELYRKLSPEHKFRLIEVREKIMPFFYLEKKIWNKAKSREVISNEEFEEFWWRKASDALFYVEIMTPFTEGMDYGKPLHVYTQLVDVVLDIKEYEKD